MTDASLASESDRMGSQSSPDRNDSEHGRQEAAESSYFPHEVRWADGLFFVGLVALLGEALWWGRGLWFYSDEWNVLVTYHDGNWMKGFNGHWSLVPVFFFRVLLALFGLRNYLPFRLVGLFWYSTLGVLFYGFAKRRIRPLAAALAALSLLWFSTAAVLVMMPFLMNFTIPLVMLLSSWRLLEHNRPSRDALAALCLLIGVMTSGVGLIVAVAVVVEFAVRREPWRRWVIFVPAAVSWITWYVTKYEPAGPGASLWTSIHWLLGLAKYYGKAAVAGWGPGTWVWPVIIIVLVFEAVVRRRWNARSAGVAVALATFASLSSTRAASPLLRVPPRPPWYLWLVSFFILALLVELWRNRTIRTPALLAVAALVALSGFQLHKSIVSFHKGSSRNRAAAIAWFSAADAVGHRADPDAGLGINIVQVKDGDYLRLAADLGSPVKGERVTDVITSSGLTRVDAWMRTQLPVTVEKSRVIGMTCRTLPGTENVHGVAIPRGATIEVTAGKEIARVRLRRFSPEMTFRPTYRLGPGRTFHIKVPADQSELPWYIATDEAVSVRSCR